MYSMKWPETVRGGADAVMSALTDVAEKSFFAIVESCEADRFQELAIPHSRWMTASVGFSERECAGEVRCTIPAALAERLYDAFTGRDPEDAAPPVAEVHDLVGEFANMLCGSWLTRAAGERTFAL